MNLGGIFGGTIAAIVGGIAWAAIAYYANVEIGYLAWGIGLLVGLGVSFGSRSGGVGAALIAVVLTVLSIVGGKYAAVQMAVHDIDAQIGDFHMEDEGVKVRLACEAVVEAREAGKKLKFPQGKNLENVEMLKDFPKTIVKQVETDFSRMTEQDVQAVKDQAEEEFHLIVNAFEAEITERGFWDSFSPMDIIFFLLAIFTAGKVAMSDVID